MQAGGTANAGALEKLSAELLDRLSKEADRPAAAPGTELVGGLVKAGAKLEDLLREVVVAAAAIERCEPERLLGPVGGPRGQKPKLQKAMAGSLAYGLRAWYGEKDSREIPPFARPLVVDILAKDSAVRAFIDVRNAVAKTGADPASARPATNKLAKVITAFRSENGWR